MPIWSPSGTNTLIFSMLLLGLATLLYVLTFSFFHQTDKLTDGQNSLLNPQLCACVPGQQPV